MIGVFNMAEIRPYLLYQRIMPSLNSNYHFIKPFRLIAGSLLFTNRRRKGERGARLKWEEGTQWKVSGKEDKHNYCTVKGGLLHILCSIFPVLLTYGKSIYTQSTDDAISHQKIKIFLPIELIFLEDFILNVHYVWSKNTVQNCIFL